MQLHTVFSLAAAVGLFTALPASAADVKGAKDPDFLKRITGSEIIWYGFAKFDEMPIALEKVQYDYGASAFKDTKKQVVEGQRTTIYYKLPGDASTLEAVRQYQELLGEAGYKTLFTAADDNLDDGYNRFVAQIFPQAKKTDSLQYLHEFNHSQQRYAALEGAGPNGAPIYISLYAFIIEDGSGSGYSTMAKEHDIQKGNCILRLDVLQTKPMDQRMSVVKAAEIEQTIAKTGRIAIYGVYFDTDKADIKPESEAALTEMATAINAAPGKKFLIVGHTDNQGGLDHNQELSRRRAASVSAALAAKYNVPAAAIIPVGVGMAAPVAPNTDEAGRAKNRRVEIVAM
jgi:outer membrane protein OmpA-like peptidoglycan-associated protein